MEQNYLVHHGVLGQKWGVRRYQNEDGSLTDAGRKRYAQDVKKYVTKASSSVEKTKNRRSFQAYNEAADEANNGLIEKYNSDYDKKLGKNAKDHDYLNDKEYHEGYQKLFNNVMNEKYEKLLYEDISKDKSFIQAKDIISKYEDLPLDSEVKESINYYKDLERKYSKVNG